MEIMLVGDVMIGRLINELLRVKPAEFVWGDTMPLLRRADLRIANLECVISDKGSPWNLTPKVFHFQSDAKNIAVLKAAGIDMVSLANNHTLDYQEEALIDMLGILNENGIGFAGAGNNLEQAMRPAIIEAGGFKTGFIAFSDNEPDWEAGKNKPGIFYMPIDPDDERAKNLLKLVEATAAQTDFLIVSTHWGPNWGYLPQPEHVPFARALVDAGADLVFGHSCHITQGIETRAGSAIIYSAGNFIDDYAVDPEERNDRSFIFAAEVEHHRVERLKLYPTVIRDFQAREAEGDKRTAIAGKMSDLCRDFGTETKWNEADGCLEIVA